MDRQTTDGVLPGCGPRTLAASCGGTPEFWLAVSEVTGTPSRPHTRQNQYQSQIPDPEIYHHTHHLELAPLMASTTPPTGGGQLWEKAAEVANGMAKSLGRRVPPEGRVRRLAIQTACLSLAGPLDSTWLADAVEITRSKRPKPARPWSCLEGVLIRLAEDWGVSLPKLLAGLPVPERCRVACSEAIAES